MLIFFYAEFALSGRVKSVLAKILSVHSALPKYVQVNVVLDSSSQS